MAEDRICARSRKLAGCRPRVGSSFIGDDQNLYEFFWKGRMNPPVPKISCLLNLTRICMRVLERQKSSRCPKSESLIGDDQNLYEDFLENKKDRCRYVKSEFLIGDDWNLYTSRVIFRKTGEVATAVLSVPSLDRRSI